MYLLQYNVHTRPYSTRNRSWYPLYVSQEVSCYIKKPVPRICGTKFRFENLRLTLQLWRRWVHVERNDTPLQMMVTPVQMVGENTNHKGHLEIQVCCRRPVFFPILPGQGKLGSCLSGLLLRLQVSPTDWTSFDDSKGNVMWRNGNHGPESETRFPLRSVQKSRMHSQLRTLCGRKFLVFISRKFGKEVVLYLHDL